MLTTQVPRQNVPSMATLPRLGQLHHGGGGSVGRAAATTLTLRPVAPPTSSQLPRPSPPHHQRHHKIEYQGGFRSRWPAIAPVRPPRMAQTAR
jgi:hypothetical protein